MPLTKRRYGRRKRKLYRVTRYKRRNFRGRRRFKKQRMSYNVIRQLEIPDTQYVKLAYTENFTWASGGLTAQYVYSGNSAYDPNFTGIGGQPAGYDQWATLYSHYQVLGSSIMVRLVNFNDAAMEMIVKPQLDSVNYGFDDSMTYPYAKYACCTGQNAKGISYTKNFMRSKKLFGRSQNSVNYGAAVTASPAAAWYWYLNFVSTNGTVELSFSWRVKIVYYVKFWERKVPVDV